MHITITGKLGSGKTTISHLISREMGYTRYSTGEYQREIAAKMGVDMVKMNEIMRTDPSFDSVQYYESKGIFAQFSKSSYTESDERAFTPAYPLYLLKKEVNDHIENLLSDRAASMVNALLLGDKSGLSASVRRDFQTLGLSHLLAVSGMHLAVLFGSWSFLLIKLRIPLKARSLILFPLTLLFCALCSFSLSVMRAAIMLWMAGAKNNALW